MATKKQIAEQAQRIILGGTPTADREIDIRDIMLYLDQIRDTRIRIDVWNGIKIGDYDISSDYFSQYENVSLQTDTAKNLRYITLPASPIDLPQERGLHSISPMQNQEEAFVRIPTASMALYRGKLSFNTETLTYYWQIGSKVYFKNVDTMLSKVLVTMAASSKDIAESATYPVPPDVESELLEQVIKTFAIMQEAPHDEKEDGVK
jgi:hypothetical protein